MWKKLRHQNIVPFLGVMQNPLQLVSEWMPNGDLTEYLSKNPGTNRIALVGPTCNHRYINADYPQAIGRSRRSHLSSCETHDTRRSERSKQLPWVVFGCVNISLPVQRSHQSQRSCPFDGFWLNLSCSWIEICQST